MAENLLSTPRSAYEVAEVQSRVYGMSKDNNFDELINQLDTMITATKTLEQQFYLELGCGNYQGFRNRIANIDNYPDLLANGSVFRYYSQKFIFPVGVKLEEAVDDLEALLNSTLLEDKEFQAELINAADGSIQELILEKVRETFRQIEFVDEKTSKTRKTRLRFKGTGGQNVGIAKLAFERIGNELKVKSTEGIIITRPLLEKIRNVAEMIQKKDKRGKQHINDAFRNAEAFRSDVIDYLRSTHRVPERVLKHAGAGEIAITRSYAGLKGFLGEVRSIAILYELFGEKILNSNFIRGTGALTFNKQEIPIDTVIKLGINQFGFQVKNFTLEEDRVTFRGKHRSAYSFIKDRLALTGTFQEIMIAFFSSYQFNQPFTDPHLQEIFSNHWLTIEQYKNYIYDNFEKMMYSDYFKSILDSRLGNILRVGMEFETKEVFGTRNMYYNTFFLIGEEYIPSSTILTNIKNTLIKDQETKAYWNTSYDFSKPSSSPILQESYQKGGKVPENLIEASKKPKVAYEIVLDVKALVEEALKN